MVSIDNKGCRKRFVFNKPYDFVDFENCDTSSYLFSHDFKNNTLFWLDYDGHISNNELIKKDIDILAKNCINNDIIFLTVNCEAPIKDEAKTAFLKEFSRYIPPELNSIKNIIPRIFPQVIQEIILNMLAESGEYNQNKFLKTCSFLYRDGASMFTLGGIFSNDSNKVISRYINNSLFNFSRKGIFQIKIPNLTYKEKIYLDSNIDVIKDLIKYSEEYWLNKCVNEEAFEANMDKFLSEELEFELSFKDLSNYVKNYRFAPQYYEGVI